MAVPPAFYLVLWAVRVPHSQAHAHGWFFEHVEAADPLLMWRLIDLVRMPLHERDAAAACYVCLYVCMYVCMRVCKVAVTVP